MRHYVGTLTVAFVSVSIAAVVVGQAPAPNPVPWAYGYLYNYQQGTRQSALVKPIVAKLSPDDMIAIAAYLGSL